MDLDFFDRTAREWILPGIFLGAVVVQLSYLFIFYLRLLFLKKSTGRVSEEPISVCLNVRNEEGRIEKVINQLLDQHYPNFEVFVVDDFSEDCTIQKIGQLAKNNPQLKFTSLNQETRFSEKLSINLALKAAQFDKVLFVRPGSQGISPNFFHKLNDCSEGAQAVITYSNYVPERKFYNRFGRIERFLSFLTSAAYSLTGIPVFYEDANVLFRKGIYFESDGFRGKMNCHFANLELVFNDKVKKGVKVSVDQETFVWEDERLEKRDFDELMRKKVSLKQSLGLGRRFLLFVEDFSKLLFLASFCWFIIVEPQSWLFITVPALFVFVLQFFIVKTMAGHLNEKKIFLSSFLYIFVRPVVHLYHAAKIYVTDKQNKWN